MSINSIYWYLHVREIEVEAAHEVLGVGDVEGEAAAAKPLNKMQNGSCADAVVHQGSTVFELLALRVSHYRTIVIVLATSD